MDKAGAVLISCSDMPGTAVAGYARGLDAVGCLYRYSFFETYSSGSMERRNILIQI
jgi:hypothetical protein